jgi:hypothetical protein
MSTKVRHSEICVANAAAGDIRIPDMMIGKGLVLPP